MSRLLVLRPEPGAAQTVAAAEALGLDAVAAPLFTVVSVAWQVPAGAFDAVMLTSAQAARHGGDGLEQLRALPCYAVGAATAAAATAVGFSVAYAGEGDAAALLATMAARGVRRALHLGGEIHRAIAQPEIMLERVIVYRTMPVAAPPVEALAVLRTGAVALLHSPAAAQLFATLADHAGLARGAIRIAAISPAAAAAAGDGWGAIGAAARPTDAALLAVAARLCEDDARAGEGA